MSLLELSWKSDSLSIKMTIITISIPLFFLTPLFRHNQNFHSFPLFCCTFSVFKEEDIHGTMFIWFFFRSTHKIFGYTPL